MGSNYASNCLKPFQSNFNDKIMTETDKLAYSMKKNLEMKSDANLLKNLLLQFSVKELTVSSIFDKIQINLSLPLL